MTFKPGDLTKWDDKYDPTCSSIELVLSQSENGRHYVWSFDAWSIDQCYLTTWTSILLKRKVSE